MPVITITCKHCTASVQTVKHKAGYIEDSAKALLEKEGWKLINGHKGICPDCNLFSFTEVLERVGL